MRLTFLGADHEVTGSCHYIEACGKRILVDFGMEQGPDMYENKDLPIPAFQLPDNPQIELWNRFSTNYVLGDA